MEILFTLSLWNGLLLMILLVTIPGIIVVFVVKGLIRNDLTKQHIRVGRLLFRVSASLLALLISLSYANEKIAYNKVTDSLEEEASLISTVFLKLKMHNSDVANMIRKDLKEYVEYTIEDDWKSAVDNPYFSGMAGTIRHINILARELPAETESQSLLKLEIISDIDLITRTMQIKYYSTHFKLPYLFYILGFGLVVTWSFFAVYTLDRVSVSFLTLYNIFVAVVIYFVIMLGNPLVGPLKIKPVPFEILSEKGLDKLSWP
ncbi:MAG: hypothetical protein ABFS32_10165 [Bacteroidota bacterium]